METGCLGGVNPTSKELAAMQQNQYILRARGGELAKVSVEKSVLPDSPPPLKGSLKDMVEKRTAIAPDGTIYFSGNTTICKSIDEGRTWTAYSRGTGPDGEEMGGYFEILADGTFLCVRRESDAGHPVPIPVWASGDEGHSWQMLSEIVISDEYTSRGLSHGMFRLSDDTLLCGISVNIGDYREGTLLTAPLLVYRSTDNGRSWEEPSLVADWCSEGGIAQLPSGKLLAVLRYGPGYAGVEGVKRPDFPLDWKKVHKTIWLADSDDQGRTWQNFRQLTTVVEQTYGFPAALSDGTVVVTHDCRFGPYPPSCRAMISYDEGQTWEDEAYFVAATRGAQSVVVADDVILTIALTGTPVLDAPHPDRAYNFEPDKVRWLTPDGSMAEIPYYSYLSAIRWQPESRG